MKARLLLLFGLSFLLFGCATVTRQDIDNAVRQWIGKSKREVIKSFGIPNQVLDDGDAKIYVYYKSFSNTTPGFSYNTEQDDAQGSGSAYGDHALANVKGQSQSSSYYVPSQTRTSKFETLFWIKNDIVIDASCSEK